MRLGTIVTGAAVIAAVIAAGTVAVVNGIWSDDTQTTAVVDHAVSATGSGSQTRDADVPDLPFADNPDPELCGIPVQWGGQPDAWLTGVYDGELIQAEVLLYESHLRYAVTASAPHGTEVEVLFHQPNPVLDYYLVDLPDQEPAWIPAPFLSFEPVS